VADREVVDSTQRYLRKLQEQGVPISFAVVFGSQARGDAHQWSDIDLLVVSPRFDEAMRGEDKKLLWRVAARTDSRIEPIPCGERQWIEDTASAIIEIARREGERILPAA
jgi:predicted nucleotidyltransferase